MSTILPRPSMVVKELARKMRRSSTGPLRMSQLADAQVKPRKFILIYSEATKAVGKAIEAHYEAHHSKTFEVLMPPDDTPVRCRYAEPPRITWRNAAAVASTVELEEATAHE